MNNEKLLVIAKAMGLDVSLKSNPVFNHPECVVIGYAGYHFTEDCNIFNPEENDTQFKEVFHWVLLNGTFAYLSEEGTEFKMYGDLIFFESNLDTLEENILETAFQVANELIN